VPRILSEDVSVHPMELFNAKLTDCEQAGMKTRPNDPAQFRQLAGHCLRTPRGKLANLRVRCDSRDVAVSLHAFP